MNNNTIFEIEGWLLNMPRRIYNSITYDVDDLSNNVEKVYQTEKDMYSIDLKDNKLFSQNQSSTDTLNFIQLPKLVELENEKQKEKIYVPTNSRLVIQLFNKSKFLHKNKPIIHLIIYQEEHSSTNGIILLPFIIKGQNDAFEPIPYIVNIEKESKNETVYLLEHLKSLFYEISDCNFHLIRDCPDPNKSQISIITNQTYIEINEIPTLHADATYNTCIKKQYYRTASVSYYINIKKMTFEYNEKNFSDLSLFDYVHLLNSNISNDKVETLDIIKDNISSIIDNISSNINSKASYFSKKTTTEIDNKIHEYLEGIRFNLDTKIQELIDIIYTLFSEKISPTTHLLKKINLYLFNKIFEYGKKTGDDNNGIKKLYFHLQSAYKNKNNNQATILYTTAFLNPFGEFKNKYDIITNMAEQNEKDYSHLYVMFCALIEHCTTIEEVNQVTTSACKNSIIIPESEIGKFINFDDNLLNKEEIKNCLPRIRERYDEHENIYYDCINFSNFAIKAHIQKKIIPKLNQDPKRSIIILIKRHQLDQKNNTLPKEIIEYLTANDLKFIKTNLSKNNKNNKNNFYKYFKIYSIKKESEVRTLSKYERKTITQYDIIGQEVYNVIKDTTKMNSSEHISKNGNLDTKLTEYINEKLKSSLYQAEIEKTIDLLFTAISKYKTVYYKTYSTLIDYCTTLEFTLNLYKRMKNWHITRDDILYYQPNSLKKLLSFHTSFEEEIKFVENKILSLFHKMNHNKIFQVLELHCKTENDSKSLENLKQKIPK